MSRPENGSSQQQPIDNASEIIDRFGGIRPMSTKMDVPVTTIQGWKKRDVIPANRRAEIVRAATTHNIDLTDLLSNVANQSAEEKAGHSVPPVSETSAQPKNSESFEDTVRETIDNSSVQSDKQHREAVLAASLADRDTDEINESIMSQVSHMNAATFKRSAVFSAIFVVAAIVLSIVLLWPSQKNMRDAVRQNGDDIQGLQGEVADLRQDQSGFRNLIPLNFRDQFDDLQSQAKAVQTRVETLSAEAEQLSQTVLSPGLSLNDRVMRLEDQVSRMGGPAQLTDILQKIQGLQASVQGQELMSGSVSELNTLIGSLQGRMDNLDEALVQAKSEDGALGQTLGGVSPEDLKAASMLLAFSQFRSSLNRNAPFEEDLAVLQKMLGEDDPALNAAISRLAPRAQQGVLTPGGLSNEFKSMAGDIVVASLKGEDVSFRDQAAARFNNVLQIEKDGELVTGTDTQAKVARAQKMLDEGNVQGALAELQTLEGAAAQQARPFIGDAEMTLLAQQIQSMLSGRISGELQNTGLLGNNGMNIGAGGFSLDRLLNEVENVIPRQVISDDASGISILAPAPMALPQ